MIQVALKHGLIKVETMKQDATHFIDTEQILNGIKPSNTKLCVTQTCLNVFESDM